LIENEREKTDLKHRLESEEQNALNWKSKYDKLHAENSSLKKSLKKFLNEDQLKVINGASHVVWSEETISKALALKVRCGNNALDFISKHVIPQPSSRTIRRAVEDMKFEPGIQRLNLKLLKKKCENLADHEKFFQIVFDEKSITPGCYFDKSTKSHLGLSTLEATEAHLKKNPDAVASHVLAFQVVGLTTRYKEIASYELTAGATKGESLWNSLKNVIGACEEIGGVKIVLIGCDMNNDNISMLDQIGVAITSKKQDNFFIHPFDNNRVIFVKPDDVHNIKNMICGFREKNVKLENCLVSAHNLSSNIANFSDVVRIYDKQKDSTFKPCPKLTQKCIDPTHFDKMRENVNDQVFSAEVIQAIKDDSIGEKTNSTAFFLECIQKFHKITYGKGWHFDEIYQEEIETLKFLLKLFSNLKFIDERDKTIFKRSQYASIVSIKTLIELSQFLFDNGASIVVPAYMLSNTIENLFSLAVARNKKQNAVQMKNTFKNITLSKHQEELLNFSGSYLLEEKENEKNEINVLKFIKEEKQNAANLKPPVHITPENTSFFAIPRTIEPTKLFNNSLEAMSFEKELKQFLGEVSASKICEMCNELLAGCESEAKNLLLQLEYIFRLVSKQLSFTSDQFTDVFRDVSDHVDFPFHCHLFKSFVQKKFLVYRRNVQHKCVKVPEASRMASRSQI
jgi:hypothetical protein